jgi:hypothetical protein
VQHVTDPVGAGESDLGDLGDIHTLEGGLRRGCGGRPVLLAQLALATILQAYTGASGDQVIGVRDGPALAGGAGLHGPRGAAVFEGTLVGFRVRLVALDLDRRLVERTVALNGSAAGQPATGKLWVVGGQSVVGSGPAGR